MQCNHTSTNIYTNKSDLIAAIVCFWLDPIYFGESHYRNIKEAFVTKALCSILLLPYAWSQGVGGKFINNACPPACGGMLISGTRSASKQHVRPWTITAPPSTEYMKEPTNMRGSYCSRPARPSPGLAAFPPLMICLTKVMRCIE